MQLILPQFKDSPGMDFSDAEGREATQVLEAVEGKDGAEYPVKWVHALSAISASQDQAKICGVPARPLLAGLDNGWYG